MSIIVGSRINIIQWVGAWVGLGGVGGKAMAHCQYPVQMLHCHDYEDDQDCSRILAHETCALRIIVSNRARILAVLGLSHSTFSPSRNKLAGLCNTICSSSMPWAAFSCLLQRDYLISGAFATFLRNKQTTASCKNLDSECTNMVTSIEWATAMALIWEKQQKLS